MPRRNTFDIEHYNGHPVNLGNQPMRQDILNALHHFLHTVVFSRHKTLFVRFDLRFPTGWTQPCEGMIERFVDSFVKNRRREGYDPALFWVCERNCRERHVHYHCILLLDGNRTMRAWEHLIEAQRFWGGTLGLPPNQHGGLVHFAGGGQETANGVMLRQDDPGLPAKFGDCFHWASYLAKSEGKDLIPKGARAFGRTRAERTAVAAGRSALFPSASPQPVF